MAVRPWRRHTPSIVSQAGNKSEYCPHATKLVAMSQVMADFETPRPLTRDLRGYPGSLLVGWVESSRPTNPAGVVWWLRRLDPPDETQKQRFPDSLGIESFACSISMVGH